MRPHLELVSTGSELLSGRTANQHARVLGEQLAPLGIALNRDTTVPDDLPTIATAVRQALTRVDVVITSGGLGPTSDDVTRDAIAEVAGQSVVMDKTALRLLEKRYRASGREVTDAARRQAQVVAGCMPLQNPVGLSPGQRLQVEGKTLFVLPGPPREFGAILEAHVLPWLREFVEGAAREPEHILLTTGLGESALVTMLEEAGFPPLGIDMAYCAAPGRVELRLVQTQGAPDVLAGAVSEVRRLLGRHVYAEERLEMHEVVGRLLAERGETLALAESCTGGLLAHRMTSCSGSSSYFMGGVVAYSNESKVRDLGIGAGLLGHHGAVSGEVAVAMASGVRDRFAVNYGVAVTGIAGPTGGTPRKPVGLVHIAVADAVGTDTTRHTFPGDRAWVKEWSCVAALDMLRRRMMDAR